MYVRTRTLSLVKHFKHVSRFSRAFSLLEVMAVTSIVGIVASIALSLGTDTANNIDDVQNQFAVLDYIQRERNAHVNRGMETEVLVICPSTAGGGCAGSGDQLVAYRAPIPVTFPPTPDKELSRQTFSGTISISPGQALIVDAYARSVDVGTAPATTQIAMVQKKSNPTIIFRPDGAVIPSFDAPAAIVVAPKISDVGTRTTPNPTPEASPSRTPRAREVFLE